MKPAADGSVNFETGEANVLTADERRKTFERLVHLKLGKRPIHLITRFDISGLLDAIEAARPWPPTRSPIYFGCSIGMRLASMVSIRQSCGARPFWEVGATPG